MVNRLYLQEVCKSYNTGSVKDILHISIAIQRDLGKLEEYADRNLMKFLKGKY